MLRASVAFEGCSHLLESSSMFGQLPREVRASACCALVPICRLHLDPRDSGPSLFSDCRLRPDHACSGGSAHHPVQGLKSTGYAQAHACDRESCCFLLEGPLHLRSMAPPLFTPLLAGAATIYERSIVRVGALAVLQLW